MMNPRRSGFTLIELMIVMLVIGLLAVIAIPFYWQTRERAYFSAMQSDLKNLAAAQEQYFGPNQKYAGAAGSDATIVTGMEYVTSKGVGVTVLEATSSGWSAAATHAALDATLKKCVLFYGSAAAVAPATSAGVITCSGL
jgi:type IV pilus assembly protein PilA